MNLPALQMQHDATDYTVAEQPLAYLTPSSGFSGLVPQYKALVREDTGDVLSVVGKDYKVLQNSQVFGRMESMICNSLQVSDLAEMEVVAKTSRNGEVAFKEWKFPTIGVPSTEESKSDIAFRIIGTNGFGGSSVKMVYGGIDYYCQNGLIMGEQISNVQFRHTKFADVDKKLDPIGQAVLNFKAQGLTWREWQDTSVSADEVSAVLKKNRWADLLIRKILNRMDVEIFDRGSTLWAAYSAMTYYASHANDAQFQVSARVLDNDNVNATLFKREQKVANVVTSKYWAELAKAA